MKKPKIGIPRIAYYYKEGVFWKHFFLGLGCKIIMSKETDKEKIKNGDNNLATDNCFQNILYFGHIMELSKSCDYILIYTNCSYYTSCINYKIFQNVIKKHLISSQILLFNNKKNNFIETIKIALNLTKNPFKILYSYIYAKDKQKKYNNNLENFEKNKINNQNNKILLVSNYNNIEDKYISSQIINYLSKNNITTLSSNHLSKKEAFFYSKYFNDQYITKDIKQLVGSIYYYQYSIKGIIYLSTNNCKLDNYIYNIIKNEIKNIPIINVESSNNINIETKLELLIDTINKDNNY